MLSRSVPAALAAGLLLFAACDSADPNFDTPPPMPPVPPPVFNPLTADFDTVDVDYAFVQPLLEARAVFPALQAANGDYAWASVFAAAEGESIVPFNADASLLIRLAESDLADTAPYAVQALEEDEVRYLRRWIEAGARSTDGALPYADTEKLLYVCNQLAGRVSIVDAERFRTIRMVDLADHGFAGGMMGALPHDVAVAPDGGSWYVSMIAADRTARFSSSLQMDPSDPAYLLAASTPLVGMEPFAKPGMVELAAGGPVLVGRSFSDVSGSTSIAEMDPQTLDFTLIPLPYSRPHAVGAVPGGRYALSASLAEADRVALIDLDAPGEPEIVDVLPLTTGPTALVQFAVAPDASRAVLTSQLTGELILLGLSGLGTSSAEVTQTGTVAVGQQPWHPIFAPDGRAVYVPNRQSHTVSFVDPVAGTVTRTVQDARFSQPHGAAVSDDGRTLYVSHRNTLTELGEGAIRYTPRYALGPQTATGLVTAIDTQTGQVTGVVETGAWASGMAYYAPAN